MKINKNKRIGEIVIIVEGSVTEFNYIEEIFHSYLGYHVISHSRKDESVKILKGHDEYSKVFIINAPTNDIVSIKNNIDFENYIYKELNKLPILTIANNQTYIVFDRDPKNNKYGVVKKLISKYKDSLTNDETINGLLLLSYPALESFLISLKEKNSFNLKMKFGKDLKEYIKLKGYSIENLDDDKITNAYNNLLNFLVKKEIINEDSEIYNFNKIGLSILELEQELYKLENVFYCVSQIIEILIDLQIIEL